MIKKSIPSSNDYLKYHIRVQTSRNFIVQTHMQHDVRSLPFPEQPIPSDQPSCSCSESEVVTSDIMVGPEQTRPFVKAGPWKTNGGRNRRKTAILTDTYKEAARIGG